MEHIQQSLFSKTYLDSFLPPKDKTSLPSSKNSRNPTFQCLDLESGQNMEWLEHPTENWLGRSWMPSTLEFRNGGVESSLSSILETDVPPKYYLSPKACLGILRRAEKRGKKLPPVLEMALKEQAGQSSLNQEAKTDAPEFTGGGISPTLNTMQGGQRQPCVAQPLPSYAVRRTAQTSSNGWGITEELSYTLDLASGQAVAQLAIGFNGDQSEKTRSMGETIEQCPTLRAGGATHVAFGPGGQHEIAHAISAGK